METVFLTLLNRSIAAGWLILVILLLRPLLKKAPGWTFCVLWGLVALRLLCPVSLESALSLIPSGATVPNGIELAQRPEIASGVPVLDGLVNPMLEAAFTPDPGASVNPLQILLPVLSLLWTVGLGAMVLYGLVSWFRLRRRVQAAIPWQEKIWLCDGIASPFILGIFRPRIYLPSDMGTEECRYVLAHERAHLRRRDHWWKPLGFLILSVYWFHPLIWLAYVLFCRDTELACDQKVVRDMALAEKKAYAETLLCWSVSRSSFRACPVAFGEVGVKTRVKHVLRDKKPGFWLGLLAVILCIAAAICFLTDPKPKNAAQTFTWSEDELSYNHVTLGSPPEWVEYRLDFADRAVMEDGTVVFTAKTAVKEDGGPLPSTEVKVYLKGAEGVCRIDVLGFGAEFIGKNNTEKNLAGVLAAYGPPTEIEEQSETQIYWYIDPADPTRRMWFEVQENELTGRMGLLRT